MALDTVHQPHSAIYTTMKFHIKASRRNRRHQQRRKGDEFSSVSSSVAMASTSDGSPSCAASSLLVDDRSSTDPSVQSPLRSCLRIHPIRKSSSPRTIRFQNVHVREFERIVGDNPSCSCGAPIGIGWKHIDRPSLALDDFERGKVFGKDSSQLVLTRQDREEILTEWGVSWDHMIQAIRTNVKVKSQRRRTVLDYDRWEDALESARRKIKHVLLLRPKGVDEHHLRAWHNRTTVTHPTQSQDHSATRSIRDDGSASVNASPEEVCSDQRLENEPLTPDGEETPRRLTSEGSMEPTKQQQHQQQHQHQQKQPQLETQSTPPSCSVDQHHPAKLELKTESQQTTVDAETVSLTVSTCPSEADSKPFMVEFMQSNDNHSMGHCRNGEDTRYDHMAAQHNYDDFDEDTLSSAYSRTGMSHCDGSFEGLTRDCSFWQLQPNGGTNDDGPQIRRLATPIIICEQDDDDDDDAVSDDDLDAEVKPRFYTSPDVGYGPVSPHMGRAPQRHHLLPPSTSFNVVSGRYNDSEDGFGGMRHNPGDASGFQNMAPQHNSSRWNWE